MSATIRRPDEGDIDWMDAGFRTGMGWSKPQGYFMGRLGEVAVGEIILLVAERRSQYLGHAFVRWRSHYPGFSERQIPEIQDLNVIARARRRGSPPHSLMRRSGSSVSAQASPASAWGSTPLMVRPSGCTSSAATSQTGLALSTRTHPWCRAASSPSTMTWSCIWSSSSDLGDRSANRPMSDRHRPAASRKRRPVTASSRQGRRRHVTPGLRRAGVRPAE